MEFHNKNSKEHNDEEDSENDESDNVSMNFEKPTPDRFAGDNEKGDTDFEGGVSKEDKNENIKVGVNKANQDFSDQTKYTSNDPRAAAPATPETEEDENEDAETKIEFGQANQHDPKDMHSWKRKFYKQETTAHLWSLSREDLFELSNYSEEIQMALQNVKCIYKGQHIKYDYSHLLYKNTRELDIASQAKEKQQFNEYDTLEVNFFFCSTFIQKLKMQILRKKILHFAKYMSKNNIEMCNMKIFQLVDHNYNYFVGE